jgi:predicted nucleotidyltransferase
MKICAIICEFNPFHNGHKYLIDQAKALSGCDAVLCIMSGSFTQRGDMALLDKFTRARHAICGGTDCVIELPAPFAVSPAEIFASGAIKLLSAIPDVTHLCFGCESVVDFTTIAKKLTSESESFKQKLNEFLSCGESYPKSYSKAFAACGGDGDVLLTPNNILAIEYAKAILLQNANIQIVPIARVGGGYSDLKLNDSYSSASAIRANLGSSDIEKHVPDFVSSDLCAAKNNEQALEYLIKYSLLSTESSTLAKIFGCSEGLENKLKNLQDKPLKEIIESATNKRYSSSRIKRILLCNALKLYQDDCKEYLCGQLYLKPLAVSTAKKEEMLAALGKSSLPVVIKGNDVKNLSGPAERCYKSDVFAQQVWDLANGKTTYINTILTI